MKICDDWQDCGVQGGGCCAAKHYEKPSIGMCTTNCKHRVIDKVPQAIIKSEPQARTQIELARQYARAELTHATQGPASEADAAARLAICMACEHRAVEYKGMTDTEKGVGWCTRCGCGSSPRALLTVKVTLAGVECPLGKFGKVSGTGASVASAVSAVGGVAKSIIHKLSGN
jgi:hypothetical protein